MMRKSTPPKVQSFPAAKQRRLETLLGKNSEGTITAREERMLKDLVAEAERLMVSNAKRLARFSASERGARRRNAVPVTVWVEPRTTRR